jgi:hypothetical protein
MDSRIERNKTSVVAFYDLVFNQEQSAETVQQQERFDDFIDCYNHERPHQALEMRYPAEL